MTPEQRVVAKARLSAARAETFEALRDEWMAKLAPTNMRRPVTVRIREWRGEAVCGATHVLEHERIPGYRVLRPGEVVVVDLEWPEVSLGLARDHLELTSEPITRPVIYESTFDAETLHPGRLANMQEREQERVDEVLERQAETVEQLAREYAKRRADAVADPLSDFNAIEQAKAAVAKAEAEASPRRRRKES